MRILLKRGFFLVCLLTPLVAYGQKWIFMPSVGMGPVWFFRGPLDDDEKPPPPGVVYKRIVLWARIDVAELAILNRDLKLGYHRVSYSLFASDVQILRYGAGIARSRRYYFASLSVGPTVLFEDITIVDAEGEIRAFYMPWRVWGFGVTVNYSVPLSRLLEVKYTEPYLGISLTLTGRIG